MEEPWPVKAASPLGLSFPLLGEALGGGWGELCSLRRRVLVHISALSEAGPCALPSQPTAHY